MKLSAVMAAHRFLIDGDLPLLLEHHVGQAQIEKALVAQFVYVMLHQFAAGGRYDFKKSPVHKDKSSVLIQNVDRLVNIVQHGLKKNRTMSISAPLPGAHPLTCPSAQDPRRGAAFPL
jgi:hypothetical protein